MNRFTMENRPRLLLVYADSAYASSCGRYFRRLGWEVRMVANGGEARRQVAHFQPTHIVVDTDLPDETGWLTSAKILLDRPELRLVVQVPEKGAEDDCFVRFLKVDALVSRQAGIEELTEMLLDAPLMQTA